MGRTECITRTIWTIPASLHRWAPRAMPICDHDRLHEQLGDVPPSEHEQQTTPPPIAVQPTCNEDAPTSEPVASTPGRRSLAAATPGVGAAAVLFALAQTAPGYRCLQSCPVNGQDLPTGRHCTQNDSTMRTGSVIDGTVARGFASLEREPGPHEQGTPRQAMGRKPGICTRAQGRGGKLERSRQPRARGTGYRR